VSDLGGMGRAPKIGAGATGSLPGPLAKRTLTFPGSAWPRPVSAGALPIARVLNAFFGVLVGAGWTTGLGATAALALAAEEAGAGFGVGFGVGLGAAVGAGVDCALTAAKTDSIDGTGDGDASGAAGEPAGGSDVLYRCANATRSLKSTLPS
jgi:hypothetical protein